MKTAGFASARSLAAWIRRVLWVLPLLTAIGGEPLRAAPPPEVDLVRLVQRLPLTRSLHYMADHQQLDFDTVRERPDADWTPNRRGAVNFGQSMQPYWLHLRLAGAERLSQTTYLRLDYPHLDRLDVYVVRDGALLREFHTGDTLPYAARPVDHRTFLFPIERDWGDRFEVYLRVESEGPIEIPLDVVTRSTLDAEDQRLFTWFGAYFGIMATMLLYNGFVFLVVRERSYFHYLVYMVVNASLQFVLQGFGFKYLWPVSTSMNNLMVLLLTGAAPFTALLFARRFIRLEALGAAWEQILARLLLGSFALIPLALLFGDYRVTLRVEFALSLLVIALLSFLSVKYSMRGERAARNFAVAWLLYLGFIAYYLLQINGIVDRNVVSMHALEIGSLLELVLLSLAFADRLNEEKELRIRAQNEALQMQLRLNRNLDSLVRARTEELEAANLRLRDMSVTDALTGLANRRRFSDCLALEYQRAYRQRDPLAVLMIDIDHFKRLNDGYGHPCGDRCIREVAAVIAGCVRRPGDLAARYGGDEFVVLLPATDMDGAYEVADQIRTAMSTLRIGNPLGELRITASIGVAAEVPPRRGRAEDLTNRADQALYRAKRDGRNRISAAEVPFAADFVAEQEPAAAGLGPRPSAPR
jgi:diguanylate cyclase